ncbi:MAG: phenylalanine--tRNA ligase subunit beta [Candidatus Pelagibacter sp. TMED275]|nr:MAG: phenylalanine--tRNA ligase subunit beta [Candidatus Pelagibacter sp. TMED275]|tara:strand:- start:1368 stop:3776 length:2409 start_codon:yes stop_codon:yes gene_type:complete
MKFTIDWLKDHLDTKFKDSQLIEKLTDIGLEVESFQSSNLDTNNFIIAKILSTEQHPNADRLKICNVDIGEENTVKVVCGAPNARKNLLTVYASPGSIIPKNQMKLSVSKIRGITSYGMLCSESELNISKEKDGITELPEKKYLNTVGKKFFKNSNPKVVDLSVTPNRPDCLGVRGIARDLAASGAGKFKENIIKKLKFKDTKKFKVTIKKHKIQGCTIFGSSLIRGVTNKESPKWLKDKILSLGQKPISAIVDITNYVMFDLNRPLHAYDLDKVDREIIVRNSTAGESFKALDNKEYKLEEEMCVIADRSGILGLGGIIGGTRTGTELNTKNILLESAYFDPRSIRKTSKRLNIETDAKFRFERGIDPESIEEGLKKATHLITKICGGDVSRFDIQKIKINKKNQINFKTSLFERITGFKVSDREIVKILNEIGFEVKIIKGFLKLSIPTWRPDIAQPIDIVEEIVRIKGFKNIKTIEPEKNRTKPTLNKQQKLFHFMQRSVASKGYYETVTWSFTDSKINKLFKEDKKEVPIINPISSDLNVLRNSIFSNLTFYTKKNLDRGLKDISLFEIGPIFLGNKPGEQLTVVGGLKSGKISRLNWNEKDRLVDVFDAKKDVMQTLIEVGFNRNKIFINDKTPAYYHPGKSGSIYLNKEDDQPVALFGEIHPNILKKLDIKTESLVGFEIYLDFIKDTKKKLKDQKPQYKQSDFQKSERDFAFVLDKNFKVQELVKIITTIDKQLIKSVKVFDVYEGENIPSDKKSIALNVTIQSFDKTLNENDLENINNLIISTVESKSSAKIRS